MPKEGLQFPTELILRAHRQILELFQLCSNLCRLGLDGDISIDPDGHADRDATFATLVCTSHDLDDGSRSRVRFGPEFCRFRVGDVGFDDAGRRVGRLVSWVANTSIYIVSKLSLDATGFGDAKVDYFAGESTLEMKEK